MHRIARNAIIDHYRRSALRPNPVAPDEVAEHAGADTDEELRPDAALAACLSPLLERVPEGYRNALELTDLGDLTQEEAACSAAGGCCAPKSPVAAG